MPQENEILNRFIDYLTSKLDETLKVLSDEEFNNRIKIFEEKIKSVSLEEDPKEAFLSFKNYFYEVYGDIVKDEKFLENTIIEFLSNFLQLNPEEVEKRLKEILG